MNSGKLKGIRIGILVLSLCLLTLAVWLNIRINNEKNHPITCDTPEEAYEYVKNHSNIFSDSSLCMAPVLWPQENFIIDLASTGTGKTFIIYCNGEDTIKVSYKAISQKPACKQFTVESDTIQNKSIYNKMLTAIDCCQSIPIDVEYEDQINKASNLKEQDRKLSRIYNILAGNREGHVILGKGTDNVWKCYQIIDFPSDTINNNRLLQFVQFHLQNKNLSPQECFESCNFIARHDDLHVVYYDFRRDTLIERNGVRVCTGGTNKRVETSEHDLKDVKLSKGWLNYKVSNSDGTQKWKLVSAYDYFVGSNRKFVKFGSSQGHTLELAHWSEKQTMPKWVIILLYAFAAGGLLLLLIGLFQQKERKQKEDAPLTSDNTPDTSIEGVKMTIVQPQTDELVSDPNTPVDIEQLKADLTQKEKDIKALEAKILALEKRPTSEQVEQIKAEAIAKYKKDNDIDNQLRRAQKWKQFVSQQSAKGIYSTLDEIRKNYPKFPQLETLKSIYESAVDSSKDLLDQMLYVLSQLETQTKSTDNWKQRFMKMRKAEEYADNVKDKYDAVKSYVEGVAKKKEVLDVLKKDSHNYLDRMALSYWSVEGFNTLLEIFKQPHLSKDNEKALQDALYFDMLQLFMTRVFFIYNADGKPTTVFQADIRKMLKERLDTLEKEYHLRSDKHEKFTETAQSLDDAYDQIRSTDEYVTRMYDTFVKEFSEKADSNEEKAWFFGMMVAMGYHTVDFVRRKKNISINLCPNYAYLLTDFDNSRLPEESYFKYKDYAHSVEYSNRIYEWLDEIGVQHLKALVGRQLIKP